MRLSADSYTGKPAPASFRHLTGLLAVLVFLILLSPPKVVAATDISGHTDIGDGKTLLNGAQILGKSIEGNTRDLEIHSPQGTMDYQSKQNALSGSVLYGYGVAVNLDYQNTRVEAHEKTVNVESGHRDTVRGVQESDNSRIQALTGSIKQNDALANGGQDTISGVSGIYAGDDGYRIHNSGTTVLGGLITSTAKAEAEGKNRFSTDRLVREDIANSSSYKGKSIALARSILVDDGIRAGRLIRLFPDDECPSPFACYTVCRAEQATQPRLVAFCQWLQDEAGRGGMIRLLCCRGAFIAILSKFYTIINFPGA